MSEENDKMKENDRVEEIETNIGTEKKKYTKEQMKEIRARRRQKKLENAENRMDYLINPTKKLVYENKIEEEKKIANENEEIDKNEKDDKGGNKEEIEGENNKDVSLLLENYLLFKEKIFLFYSIFVLFSFYLSFINYALFSLIFLIISTEAIVLSISKKTAYNENSKILNFLSNFAPSLLSTFISSRRIVAFFIFAIVIFDQIQ
jgi:hypothetical protein